MAKKKNKKNVPQKAKLSPERFLREKARSMQIGKCYITPEWEDRGNADVIVSRKRSDGNLAVGMFLVDTFCMGVKDALYNTDMSPEEFNDMVRHMEEEAGLEEISYNEAHNLIYGSIAFAEEGGIEPTKSFNLASYILEEDTDDIPLIEYEYGKDGKHFLVIYGNQIEKQALNQLHITLGEGNFNYIYDLGEQFDDGEDDDYEDDLEKYSYEYPQYPSELSLKHQFIVSELYSPDNAQALPDETIEKILSLPADEAAQELSDLVLFEIGRTYRAINDGTIEDAVNLPLLHAIYLLTQLRSEKGLDAVLEIMHQNGEFADYHFGDLAPEVLPPALYACGKDNVQAIVDYLDTPGIEAYMKANAFGALAMIAVLHPERREEIIQVFKDYMKRMKERLPLKYACDGDLAGFLISTLSDLNATELLPEIKALFDTGCVELGIVGDYKDVEGNMRDNTPYLTDYQFPDIKEQYKRLQTFCG